MAKLAIISVLLTMYVARLTAVPAIYSGTTETPEPCPADLCATDSGSGWLTGTFVFATNPRKYYECLGDIRGAACFTCPEGTVYSLECKACMYSLEDACYTTQEPTTLPTLPPCQRTAAQIFCDNRPLDDPNLNNEGWCYTDPNNPGVFFVCLKDQLAQCFNCPLFTFFEEATQCCQSFVTRK